MKIRTFMFAAVIAAGCAFPIQAAEQLVAEPPAESEKDQAFDIRPAPAPAKAKLAVVDSSHIQRMAQYEALLAEVNRSIQANPRYLATYRTKASILLQMGRQTDAARVAEEIVEAYPQAAEAYEIASGIYVLLDLRDKGCCQSNCTEATEDVIFVSREMEFWPSASGPGT